MARGTIMKIIAIIRNDMMICIVLDIRHHVAYLHGGFRNGVPTHP